MPTQNQTENNILPEIETYINRFSFIKDSLLRNNLGISFKYVSYLLTLYEKDGISGYIRYSLAKDIIETTASIVEAISHYWIQQEITLGDIPLEKAFPVKHEYKWIKDIVIDEDGDKIVACREISSNTNLQGEIKFIDLNRALKRSNLITNSLFKRVENLRKQRNNIHLKGLNDGIENLFKDEDLEEAFKVAKDIIEKVEKYTTIEE
jgi:hypothetical protein